MTGDITKKFGFLNEPRGYAFRGYTVGKKKTILISLYAYICLIPFLK